MRAMSENQRDALLGGRLPEVEEVRPGIHAIPIDMPGMQPPYAYVYAVLADGPSREVHLVDAGLDSDGNWAALDSALRGLGRSVDDIASVTITHLHRDHLGLAARMRAASGAVVRMHEREAAGLRARARYGGAEDAAAALARWGVPKEDRTGLAAVAEAQAAGDEVSRAEGGSSTPDQPLTVDETVRDGQVVRLGRYEAVAIHTPGHTPGHLCLAIPELGTVFTGDHVLPVINPGIALGGERSADPLGEYYASLDRLAPYAAAEALPGHGFRFATLGERCAEIRAHHEVRTREAASILAADPGLSVWEVARRITWTYGWDGLIGVNRLSALAQTEMHMERVRAAARE